MLSIFLQHWRQRPARFLFTLASLVLSTATLIGILVASHNARSSFKELGKALQGLPCLDIVHDLGQRFELASIQSIPPSNRITAMLPMLIRGSILRHKEEKSRGLVIGLPLSQMTSTQKTFLSDALDIEENQWPGQEECWISVLVANQLRVQEGATIQCLFRRGFRKLQVKKVVTANHWNRIANEHGIIVDLDWLQNASAIKGQIDRMRVFLKSDDESEKRKEAKDLSMHLEPPLKVQERSNNVGVADDLLKSTELGLSFASALAVAMAAYILLNTTRMNLAERRPHFAILKCLGATSSQITRSVMIEACILSVSGVSIGIGFGCGIGFLMGRVLAAVMQAQAGAFSLPLLPVVLVAFAIPCLSLLVVWYAQRQQDNVSPLESFREPTVDENPHLPWRSIGLGVALWILSLFGLYCVQQEWISAQWGVVAGLISLIAYLLWLPLGLVPLTWLFDWLAKQRNGFPIEIAKNQLVRRPERTTLNAGFLVIALCGAVGLGQILMSNTAEILRWYHRALPGDLFLLSVRDPSMLIDSEDPLRETIEQLPGLVWSNAIRFVRCTVDEQPVLAIVREFPPKAPFPTEPRGMDEATARNLIENDTIFVASILAKKLGKKAGDNVIISFNGRSFPMTIGGVNSNFANGGMSIMIQRSTAQKHIELTGFDWYALSVDPTQLDAAFHEMQNVKQQFGFEVQRGNELRKGVEQAISGVTAGMWSVVFISFLTGGFGIATTLAMNMIEQARDFSLMRIVGASSGQLMFTVMMQAWLLGTIGVIFGLIGGVTTVIIIWACSEALLGYTPDFRWDPWLMLGSAVGTMVIVTIAAWLPAWKVSKINPVEHLSYE